MGFTAMIVPVGDWRFTSEDNENWTAASLFTLTQIVQFGHMPTGEQLVDSYRTYSDVVDQQLKSKLEKQGRAEGYAALLHHFEAYIYDEASAPSYEEFMVYLLGSGGPRPLAHIRFDWTMAMPVNMSQSA